MNKSGLHNERDLLARVVSGDQQAFASIVRHYTRIIYGHLLSYTKDAQRAEELTQDIFISIWKHREKLPAIENFGGYVYAITRNKAISALKERLSATPTCHEDKLQEFLVLPDPSLELKELSTLLNNAINALPARRKEVFMLSRKEQLTYEEIAAQLNISRSAVRQHVVEALVFLRNYLKEKSGIIITVITWLLLLAM